MESGIGESDYLSCCGSTKFAEEMVSAGPFIDYGDAVNAAREIWFNKVDVNGWLEAFSAHPQIGQNPSSGHGSRTSTQWSKGEQSTALATATNDSLQDLHDWNTRYKQKFGFIFIICASGRSTLEILSEIKRRYPNRPIVEFEIAAQEQMKITELRLSKLFSTKDCASSTINPQRTADAVATKAGEDRMNIIGSHLTALQESPIQKPLHVSTRTRPPITTHVLDVARGSPASGIEVRLEMQKSHRPEFGNPDLDCWTLIGTSTTDKDGRSGQIMSIVDDISPGVYRISFNTGKYNPSGFFPYVSIVFEIRDSQKREHFHVPLLLSPFSFSTYRGS